ncbi:MAG: GntR family transcriptional regulator, partial [Ruminococcus sp.]|nr:GntR family transcriptional regulator [Ruminococcus sp.]
LPSVRALAAELGVNPNTVAKAYRELEAQGVTYSSAGKGCFISDAPQSENADSAILRQFDEVCQSALAQGISEDELQKRLRGIFKGGKDNDRSKKPD